MPCDTNGDNVPDSRQFAGSHRYNTAVALAERFAADEGSISTVILASGESQVDAVTASGLAGNLNAPVLLTRSSRLPHNVARFIDEQNVTDVVIVGGTAAVSDDVVTALESLGSRPEVERVSGADRYATAAAIGDRLGGPNPTWCGSDQSAAILVNGGDAGRADAIVIGPLAFRLGLPVLLTSADSVPEATASFLTDNKVERVVVVGGMTAVSGDVVDEMVENIGVVNVQRISGGSAAGTSVMVAKEMLGNCADVLTTNRDMVALVNRDATADGIAAAPVLGRGLGGGGSVPIMLVGDELPAAVNDYLAATAEWRAGHGKTHEGIVAIGGTAVVSNSVMADAVAAAKTSSALTATIKPLKYTTATLAAARAGTTPFTAVVPGAASKSVGDYETRFTVTFSDDVRLAEDGTDANDTVDAAERVGTVEDPTMYRVNGRRIAASTVDGGATDEPVSLVDLVFTADRTVTLSLSHHLEAGDTITVDNSANEAKGSRLGLAGTNPPAGNDLRKLEAASLTLPAVTIAADRTAPVVEVVAVPGQTNNDFFVLVNEPEMLFTELGTGVDARALSLTATTNLDRLREFVKIDGRGNRLVRVAGVAQSAIETAPEKAWGRASVTHRYNFTVEVGTTDGDGNVAWTAGPLEWDDVIIVERKTFLDKGGRSNALERYRVPKVKTNTRPSAGTGNLEVHSVSIGDYDHTQSQAFATIATDVMVVTAKATGVASGARGNGWRIFGYDDRAEGATSTSAFEIDVAVDIANQRISYTIEDALPIRPHRGAQIGDLAAALVSNGDFAANFGVSYVTPAPATRKETPLTATVPAGLPLMNGRSAVGVVVEFNAAVNTLAADGLTLAQGVAPRLSSTVTTVTTAAPTNDAPKAVIVSFRAPDNEVHISYHSDNMAELPTRNGFRVIADGVATGFTDSSASLPATQHVATAVSNIREILNSLRPNSSIKP